jgi:hypothetical protein
MAVLSSIEGAEKKEKKRNGCISRHIRCKQETQRNKAKWMGLVIKNRFQQVVQIDFFESIRSMSSIMTSLGNLIWEMGDGAAESVYGGRDMH